MPYEMCDARKHLNGEPCKRPAGWGTDHPGWGRCKWHGGCSESGRQSAEVARIEHDARQMLERLGEPVPVTDPVGAAFDGLAEASAWLDILREALAELRSLSTFDNFGVDRERAVAVLYERALDRRQRFATEISRLGLEERRVVIQESQATFVTAALIRVLGQLGLDEPTQFQARQLLAGELEAVPDW